MRFAGQGFEKFTIARTGQTDRHTQRDRRDRMYHLTALAGGNKLSTSPRLVALHQPVVTQLTAHDNDNDHINNNTCTNSYYLRKASRVLSRYRNRSMQPLLFWWCLIAVVGQAAFHVCNVQHHDRYNTVKNEIPPAFTDCVRHYSLTHLRCKY